MAKIPPTEQYRSYLFAIAYRMLGSVSDAEDIMQECFLRWQAMASDASIESPRAYLATIVTRLCIEHLRKAHVKRETYVGPWLPEPLLAMQSATPSTETQHEQREEVSTAFLLILERLSPVERAAFLLRKAFDYNYREIAAIIEKTEEHCRQIVRRAQEHIDEQKPRFPSNQEAQERIVFQFLQCCTDGDMTGLLSLLAEDAVFISDSDGKAKAARRPVYGADKVARLLLSLIRKSPAHFTLHLTHLNGAPAIVLYEGDIAKSSSILEIDGDKISAIYSMVNPEKLGHLNGASNSL